MAIKKDKFRIISIDASDVKSAINKNGKEVGVVFSKEDLKNYYAKFDNILDFSLDSIELQNAFKKIFKKQEKFSFSDENGVLYTEAVVNLSFSYRYNENNGKKESITTRKLREELYSDGFVLNGKRYVRYKRSAGSSREGKCLFIREELLAHMEKWGECGLKKENGDLASWEAYKALSLSAIKDVVDIPIEGILFVEDYYDKFEEEVVAVRKEGENKVVSKCEKVTISNNIWDGESLLEESIFINNCPDKHMMLLRNKFFKSCAFRTKIQKWFADNNVTSIEQLKACGGVTLAEDISQIVMITTPSSLKYLKFAGDKLTKKAVKDWSRCVKNSPFGVVKYDKRTRYFQGSMVRTSYQFLNTVGLKSEEADCFVDDNVELLKKMREDPSVMRHYFKELCKREQEDDDRKEIADDGIFSRADVIWPLLDHNSEFAKTKIYYNFRNDVTDKIRGELKKGHLLVDGTYATLFGNGPELLKKAIGTFNRDNTLLKKGEIRISSKNHMLDGGKDLFREGQELVCARSPHITMGNLYVVKNAYNSSEWEYFSLGDQIVCVNAIGENIQHRLNGCDYDSDTMLITSNTTLVEVAKRTYEDFKVPVCLIKEKKRNDIGPAECDSSTSNNKIGEIVNLSQRLNSLLWDRYNDHHDMEEVLEIYNDICILAVLSGIEIDKAKRDYDVNCASIIAYIRKKHEEDIKKKPRFFEVIDEEKKEYAFFNTPMDYIYTKIKDKANFMPGREQKNEVVALSSMLNDVSEAPNYYIGRTVIEKLSECNERIKKLRKYLRRRSAEEGEVIRENIALEKKSCEEEVLCKIKDEATLKYIIERLEDKEINDWVYYSILLNESNPFLKTLVAKSDWFLPYLYDDDIGSIILCGHNFSKNEG